MDPVGSAGSSAAEQTVLGAIHEKYDAKDDEELSFVVFVQVPKGAPGKQDTGEIVVPRDLYLNQCNISSTGDIAQVSKLCANVNELHLAENQIADWEEVGRILECFPSISVLNLSSNPVGTVPLLSQNWPADKTYPKIRTLIMNYLSLPWESIQRLLQAFPNVAEIHLSFNNLSTVQLDIFDEQTFESIETLNINGNKFEEWHEISKFGKLFPQMKVLHMLDNAIKSFPSDNDDVGKDLKNLELLCLRNCPFDSWSMLEKFRYLPSLTALKLSRKIPILEGLEEKIRRQLLLGYLPNLTSLNGGKISENEREDAERAFIRYYMDQDEKPNRFHELEAKIGKLDHLVEIDLKVSDTVTVTVEMDGRPSQLRKINLHWTVPELKKALRDYADLPVSAMKCYHYRDDVAWGADFMQFPQRTMLRYGVEEGSNIIVEKKS